MSLVAAYSDSESGSDSEEDENRVPSNADFNVVSSSLTQVEVEKSNERGTNEGAEGDSPHFQIEDDDDWMASSTSDFSSQRHQGLFSALPQPKSKELDVVEEMDDEFISKVDKYETVDEPLPKSTESSKKLNTEVAKGKSSSLILPAPLTGGTRKGPVKITIPSLDDTGSDSDDEDSKSTRKSILASKTKSTLISMLPKPKNSVTVGSNKNKMFTPQTNRPLIPHTLTKSKETTSKVKKTAPTGTRNGNSLVDNISDSDGEEDGSVGVSNFFSLDAQHSSTTACDSTTVPSNLSTAVHFNTVPSNIAETLNPFSSCTSQSRSEAGASSGSKSKPKAQLELNKPTVIQDGNSGNTGNASKGNSFFANMFKSKEDEKSIKDSSTRPRTSSHTTQLSSNTRSHSGVTGSYGSVTGPYGEVSEPYGSVTGPYSAVTAPYGNASTALPSALQEPSSRTHHMNTEYSDNIPQEHHHLPMCASSRDIPNEDVAITQDAIRQLQGSKRKHEKINIIDIQGPDVRGDREQLLRNSTTDMMAQQKKKNDEDAPTGQQKRKHQIQYLAHQAKEREFQLQQQWAESRATKQVTQAKYGF